ncbi:MAG: DUF2334 domain-containing protein [Candidatus Bathyarchaeia archaeon]
MSLSTTHALFPVGDRAVVIRIDDVQDYGQPSPYSEPEKRLLQHHIDEQIPALISIIPTRFGKDPQLVDQIKVGLELNIFTVAIHGWHHEDFSNLTKDVQSEKMRYGKSRLETILGVEVLAFVPPYDKFNSETVTALRRSGLTLISSSTYEGDIPRQEDGIVFLPRTVTTAEVVSQSDTWTPLPLESVTKQIEESWVSYGVAVIVVHPRQFISENGEDRWSTYIRLLEWIHMNRGRLVQAEPPHPKKTPVQLDSLLVSVGLFSGMVSTLLIAFNLSSRRRICGRQTDFKGVTELSAPRTGTPLRERRILSVRYTAYLM